MVYIPYLFLFNKCIKIKNSHLFKGIKNSDKIKDIKIIL